MFLLNSTRVDLSFCVAIPTAALRRMEVEENTFLPDKCDFTVFFVQPNQLDGGVNRFTRFGHHFKTDVVDEGVLVNMSRCWFWG